jgi:3-hydroxyacyl-CoA dehydrogenase/3-hydroxy-2-methylbutyryl-CoA dehydrogenase
MLSRTIALVTGGSSGLGAATVNYLTKHGARVIVADLTPSAETTNASVFITTDVTQSESVSAALDLAERTFGEPVNAVVNCAGIAVAKKTLNKHGQAHSLEDFLRVLAVNTTGTFNVNRLAAERMAARLVGQDGLRGCIVNTASIAAFEGQMGQVAYAASKGAIVAMTLPMARELAAYKIRVMTIVCIYAAWN